MMMTPTWDCEYGNYRDMNNECDWRDDFFPRKRARQEAQDKYNEWKREMLDEIADDNGLDTSDWTKEDYGDFADMMDLY